MRAHRNTSLVAQSLVIAALFAAGCRSSNSDESGEGGESSTGSDKTSATVTGTGQSGSGQNMTSGSTGTGVVGCEGPDSTVEAVTKGEVGLGTAVTLRGVVAMSQKFLVSGSNSCLWGVFVSAPGITETKENSGLLVLSYGTEPMIPPGGDKAFCPRLGQDPAGDKIPDNVKPGDVLDLIGTADYFPTQPNCTTDNDPNDELPTPMNTVPMRQLSKVCSATITGTAPVPTPKVMSAVQLAQITSTSDTAFHDAWGGVKVRVENVGVVPEMMEHSPTPDGPVLYKFGIVKLDTGAAPIEVGDKIYYRPYSNNKCHEGPTFQDPAMMFTKVDGFHYLSFCTWGLQVDDKCADFAPGSPDCMGAATCPPDMID